MPRTIPIALASHNAGSATTTCMLLKITPAQPGYAPFGITTLDVDVHYNDGHGMLLYSAAIGSELTNMTSSSDTTVNGGETKQLMPVFDTPMSEAALRAGACDYAQFIAYLINYNDLTTGHHAIIQSGTLGETQVTDSGLTWTNELRGLTQPLKQSITEKWSLTCRAVFGSTTPTPQSRFPCNFNADALWVTGTVLALGVDNTYNFSCAPLSLPYGGAPGLINWLTGQNAGRYDETESIDILEGPPSTNYLIGLTFGSSYPIAIGDTFRYRDDCPKTPQACQDRSNFQNYRGEPSIPVSDNGALRVGLIGGSVSTTTGD